MRQHHALIFRFALLALLAAFPSHASAQDSAHVNKQRGGFNRAIRKVYNKLDSSKTTARQIREKINNITGKATDKYHAIDSVTHTDSFKASGTVNKVQQVREALKTTPPTGQVITTSPDKDKRFIQGMAFDHDGRNDSGIRTIPDPAPDPVATNLVEKAEQRLNNNDAKGAAVFYEMGLEAARKANSPTAAGEALKGLSQAYARQSDVKKAMQYYDEYTALRDSLFRIRQEQAMSDIDNRYALAKKQGEIRSLQEEGQLKNEEIGQSHSYIARQRQIITLIALSLVLLVILSVVLYRQYRQKKRTSDTLQTQNATITSQKKELEDTLAYARQLQQALQDDLDHYMQLALRKQMNPHFIFNSLNSIQAFILQNDKLSANIYLSKFASLMRKVLENSRHNEITLEQELEVLKLYVELEQQRFDNNFSCTWDVPNDEDTLESMVPPLIMQPYIENAIWHGLLHKEGERKLLISVRHEGHLLRCIVEDNGIGRDAAMKVRKQQPGQQSLGTAITQKRIDLLNSLNRTDIGVAYQDLRDTAGQPCGTRVTVSIPLEEA